MRLAKTAEAPERLPAEAQPLARLVQAEARCVISKASSALRELVLHARAPAPSLPTLAPSAKAKGASYGSVVLTPKFPPASKMALASASLVAEQPDPPVALPAISTSCCTCESIRSMSRK